MSNFDRDLSNPILKYKLLFWACYFKMPIEIIKSIMTLRCCYPFAPVFQVNSMNSMQISAQKNNIQALNFLIEESKRPRNDLKKLAVQRAQENTLFPNF